jgi:acyl-CoA thioesterase FadM
LLSAVFDGALGSLFTMSGVSGFTANLNVDYRKPVTIPSVLMLRAEITKREGRKLWLTGQLTDPVLDSSGRSRTDAAVYVEGTGLFLESV